SLQGIYTNAYIITDELLHSAETPPDRRPPPPHERDILPRGRGLRLRRARQRQVLRHLLRHRLQRRQPVGIRGRGRHGGAGVRNGGGHGGVRGAVRGEQGVHGVRVGVHRRGRVEARSGTQVLDEGG